MRISDWSSDVCSSDLISGVEQRRIASIGNGPDTRRVGAVVLRRDAAKVLADHQQALRAAHYGPRKGLAERKSVVKGTSVSVRVDLGGRRGFQKKHICSTRTIPTQVY